MWIENDEYLARKWSDRADFAYRSAEGDEIFTREEIATKTLADDLKQAIGEDAPHLESMFADLLNAALCEVDWHEIAATLLDLHRSVPTA